MPLVRIDVIKNQRSGQELRLLADTIQQVLQDHFHAPPRDRYQIISQHEPDELICDDTGLGLDYARTDQLVVIQIVQQGRDAATKQKTFAALADALASRCGLKGGDLIISCVGNAREDWSFGYGEAQFVTGRL
ncbi:hypothetical protein A1O3_00822 [Capronia epimyces CBS 606.96]|uniref:Tautomerase n=1 Tax=Capronia epimyces CBS 606.96 TaxID=1182542 RepID=W9YH97_9EURO|nr:uncharacterized protein A1O3_00822 [Capronia epimyces CBS 606.96]EXJ92272.1 hypothetical protein A1O3_00822 [Capronia epimyces CBS 606.96]